MNTLLATASARGAPRAEGRRSALGGGAWCVDAQCYRGIPWGIESWFEPAIGKVLRQDLDFFPVDRDQCASPLILHLHPPRDTKMIVPACSLLYARLVQVARASGFSVASIEYRQPVLDDLAAPAPDNDIAQARRWAHAHAGWLGVDASNVFLVDQSHGALGLWTVLQQRHDPAVRVNAAYRHESRTSPRGVEVARRFVVEADWLDFVDPIAPENAYDGVIPFFQRHLR